MCYSIECSVGIDHLIVTFHTQHTHIWEDNSPSKLHHFSKLNKFELFTEIEPHKLVRVEWKCECIVVRQKVFQSSDDVTHERYFVDAVDELCSPFIQKIHINSKSYPFLFLFLDNKNHRKKNKHKTQNLEKTEKRQIQFVQRDCTQQKCNQFHKFGNRTQLLCWAF
jgi:hypothetical protein